MTDAEFNKIADLLLAEETDSLYWALWARMENAPPFASRETLERITDSMVRRLQERRTAPAQRAQARSAVGANAPVPGRPPPGSARTVLGTRTPVTASRASGVAPLTTPPAGGPRAARAPVGSATNAVPTPDPFSADAWPETTPTVGPVAKPAADSGKNVSPRTTRIPGLEEASMPVAANASSREKVTIDPFNCLMDSSGVIPGPPVQSTSGSHEGEYEEPGKIDSFAPPPAPLPPPEVRTAERCRAVRLTTLGIWLDRLAAAAPPADNIARYARMRMLDDVNWICGGFDDAARRFQSADDAKKASERIYEGAFKIWRDAIPEKGFTLREIEAAAGELAVKLNGIESLRERVKVVLSGVRYSHSDHYLDPSEQHTPDLRVLPLSFRIEPGGPNDAYFPAQVMPYDSRKFLPEAGQ